MKRFLAFLILASVLAVPHVSQAETQAPHPSIVVVFTDDQRKDTLSPGVMPHTLTNMTQIQNGMVTNPLCCPSRASLLTGQYSHNNGVWRNDEPDGGWPEFVPHEPNTIATQLNDAGYYTSLIGKYLNSYGSNAPPGYVPVGWDDWQAYTRPNYVAGDYIVNDNGTEEIPEKYAANDLGDRVVETIHNVPTTDPLFMLVTPYIPHNPTTPEPQYSTAFDTMEPWRDEAVWEADVKDKPDWVKAQEVPSAEEQAIFDEHRQRQHETLLSLDVQMGRLFQALSDTGRLEETLVIFTSDNGYQWGEHRVWGKNVPYDDSVRVPWAMRVGSEIVDPSQLLDLSLSEDIFTNIDIAPTARELAGLPPDPEMDGESFLGRLNGTDGNWRTRSLIEHAEGGVAPAYCASRSTTRLYVRYTGGAEEFYNYVTDPLELVNKAKTNQNKPTEEYTSLKNFAKHRCGPNSGEEIPGFVWGAVGGGRR